MEIELGPIQKYESVRQNAYWTRAGIDTRLRVDKDNIADYKAHLRDCEKNPTVGMLAGRKYITGKPMNYPKTATRNLCYMNRKPEISSLRKSIKNKIRKTLYKKTWPLRQYIINSERVVLDSVKKTRKYTIFNKLRIVLKRFI